MLLLPWRLFTPQGWNPQGSPQAGALHAQEPWQKPGATLRKAISCKSITSVHDFFFFSFGFRQKWKPEQSLTWLHKRECKNNP